MTLNLILIGDKSSRRSLTKAAKRFLKFYGSINNHCWLFTCIVVYLSEMKTLKSDHVPCLVHMVKTHILLLLMIVPDIQGSYKRNMCSRFERRRNQVVKMRYHRLLEWKFISMEIFGNLLECCSANKNSIYKFFKNCAIKLWIFFDLFKFRSSFYFIARL